MKKRILKLVLGMIVVLCLTACQKNDSTPDSTQETSLVTNALIDSYYLGQDSEAYDYFHHSSIQRFLSMWVKNETGDIDQPIWHNDTFTKIDYVDQDLKVLYPDEQLYCCNFSYQNNRYGYIVFAYHSADPSITHYDVKETTPYAYDLKMNMNEIRDQLMKTDIDLATVQARRLDLYDSVKKRADQVIEFTDEKGNHYLCDYGDPSFEVKKWEVEVQTDE